MLAEIVIPIAKGDGSVSNKTIVIPKSANVTGTCGEEMQRITVVWGNTRESGKLVKSGQLTMLFQVSDMSLSVAFYEKYLVFISFVLAESVRFRDLFDGRLEHDRAVPG